MDVQTIPQTSPLHIECMMRALRHSLWVALFLAQELHLSALEYQVFAALVEVDRLLGEFDLQ